MNITKKYLSRKLSSILDIPSDTSKSIVESFFQIKKRKIKTNNIRISKFGSYNLKMSPSRIGRNPKTLEEYKIPKRLKVSFKCSNKIKKLFN